MTKLAQHLDTYVTWLLEQAGIQFESIEQQKVRLVK
jgi:hypothetical protein